jgi:hypothetical protein
MAGSLKLSFIIEAIDRATATVRKVNERIDKVAEPVRKVRASFNALLRESHLPRMATLAQEVSSRFDGVTRSARGIAAAALIVAGAGAAMWLPLKHVIDAGSRVNDTAATLGVSARQFQRIAYALTLDGSSAEDAAIGLRFLQKNAVEAITGSKEMALWFTRAGISADFLQKNLHDPIALTHALADGMQRLPTAAQRIAVMQALLSRGGPRLAQTFSRGAAELRRLGDEAEALGAVMDDKTVAAMDDAGDSITRMERSIGGLFNAITAAALPAVERIVGNVTRWAVANRALIASRVTEFVERLIERLPEIANTTLRVIAGLGALIGILDRVVQFFGGLENVLALVAGLIVGKFLLSVALLIKSLGALTLVTGKFGLVLALTPIGWFIGIVAALVALAYVIIRNWEPISEFFIGMWDAVKGAFTDAFEWIANKIAAVTEFVTGAITRLDQLTPDWVKRFTLPGAVLSAAANAVRSSPAAAPSALATAGAGRTDVGGVIRIEIDQEGRARVAGMKNNNPDVDFNVDAGPMFVMP